MSLFGTLFLDRWIRVLAENRDRPALLATDGSVLATFSEIEEESHFWADRVAHLPPRSAVGIQMGNHPAWPAILLALWQANHVALLLDSSLQEELTGDILRSASAKAVIRNDQIHPLASTVDNHFNAKTSLCKVTSGTSGTPRLIEFSSEQLLADSDNICTTMGLTSADVNYGAIPFSHSYGFSNLLTPLLTQGIPLVVADDYLPHSLLDGLARTRATVLPGIPVLYQSLARLALRLPETVRLCITAGAPLSSETARLFHDQNGRKIHSFYGASECGGICYDASESIDLPPGFVGQALDGVKVEPNGDTQKIVVRSRAVGLGYYPVLEKDILANGEFRPQDLVEFGGHGIRIIGRESDFINITGKKLDPQIVEAVIGKMTNVSRVIVFGIPDPRRGEIVIAAVEGGSLDSAAILTECRRVLAPWQVPADIWLCKEIPISQRGKINRRALSEIYRAERAFKSQ